MKKLCLVGVILLLFTGCAEPETELQRGMNLRDRLSEEGCRFNATITADYGPYSYEFSVDCHTGEEGDLLFSVCEPESIAGINGKITAESGFLTFNDVALAFPLLADGEFSPVSAPWIFITALRSGYLVAAGKEGDSCRLTYHDSYEADALQVDIWVDNQNTPVSAEILWQGRCILSLHIEGFVFV